ncbi:tetraspanin-19-like isoform X1 [Senna tora]|uniref:Tetraspanin-19-like isoform X1 n=1 Tax=Senna tora TaxID=362788 RepID=A0A834SH44_9FABA|nr:tetraspanin-19-like isoform X1 [Senna tora]
MMKSEIARPLKRKRTQEQSDDGEVDLLSMLPDSIIVSILSQLTIAEAARTCVLSLRWRYLWTYYFGSLHFDASLVRNDRTSSLWTDKRDLFKRRVDQVLNSLQTQTLEALEICFELGNDIHVDKWVQFAIQKKVKKLELKLGLSSFNTIEYHYKRFDVPPSLLKWSSLPSLQVLRLSCVDVSGEEVEYLLSSCPSLQTLSVVSSKRLWNLRVCSHSNIKELEILAWYENQITLEICSENLRSFSYFGHYESINYEHIPNLKEVCFGGSGVDGLFNDFFHLKNYDHSSYLKMKFELPDNMVLANLQHLEIDYRFMEQNALSDINQPLKVETNHAYDCLEEVKLVDFSGGASEVKFIKYIIKNASNLMKILLGRTARHSLPGILMRRTLAPFTPPRVEFVVPQFVAAEKALHLMMAAVAVGCLKSLLKLINYVMGMVGMAFILYGLWLLRAWQREIDTSFDFASTTPWFAYTSMGIGVSFCLITSLGHMAGDSINDYCLSSDLPEDPSGKFDGFKDFVASNMEICKWIGLMITSAQGLSILLAMALRAIGPYQAPKMYVSDEDYGQTRVPLMNHTSQPPQYAVAGGPHIGSSTNTSWNVGKSKRTLNSEV